MARFRAEEDFYEQTLKRAERYIGGTLVGVIATANCESPIERILFAELYSWFRFATPMPFVYVCNLDDEDPFHETFGIIRLYTQLPIGEYRVDFALKLALERREIVFVIECDGHEFHERTKEQAARDRARDRKLQSLDYTVYRFTGSEIWASPADCAGEVFKSFLKKLNREVGNYDG